MANVFSKTPNANGIYTYRRSVNSPDYSTDDWIINPDVSTLTGSPLIPERYWKASASPLGVVEMTQDEKDAVDSVLSPVEGYSPGVGYVKELTYTAEEEKSIFLPYAMPDVVIHVLDPNREELINATLKSASGTGWDPGNVSTNEANINNGNLTDLTYNNSASGNTSGKILGIDLGTPTQVSAMKRYDYSASYYDTEWEFIGTNDLGGSPQTYTVIFTATQNSPNLNPDPYFRAFTPVTFRYYGWRCVTSYNATYTITSELELYEGEVVNVEKELVKSTDYDYKIISSTEIVVKNLSSETKTLKTVVVGK